MRIARPQHGAHSGARTVRSACGLVVLWLVSWLVMGPAAPTAAAAAAGPADVGTTPGASGGDTELDRYLAGLHTLRTQFTQTVTDPHGKLTESGSGSLLVERPGRFRWDYQPHEQGQPHQSGQPHEQGGSAGGGASDGDTGQLLVADGRNLWFYDRELAQVTVKPLSAALSATPIMLLSGSLSDLRTSFQVLADGRQDGLSWVVVRPQTAQADFSEARLGFRGQELARMIVHDMLGQSVQLDFSHSQRNGPIDPRAFQFQVPPGVDVIGTPQH